MSLKPPGLEPTIDDSSREKEKKPVYFEIGIRQGSSLIDEIYSEKEVDEMDKEDYPPNLRWEKVTVKSEKDKKEWLELRKELLKINETPSYRSTDEDKENDKKEAKRIKKELEKLEIEKEVF